MGLPAVAAAIPPGPAPLCRAGACTAARHRERQGAGAAHPRAFRHFLGRDRHRRPSHREPWRAAHRVQRACRRERALPGPGSLDDGVRRDRAFGHGLFWLLPHGREDRDRHRRLRARLHLGRARGKTRSRRDDEGRPRHVGRRAALSLSCRREYRGGDHALDDLLPAVGGGREEALGGRSPGGAARHGARSHPDPARHGGGAGRDSGDPWGSVAALH